MNASSPIETLPAIGAEVPGGFHIGAIEFGGSRFRLTLPPKADRLITGAWNKSLKSVAGALSYCDGQANTEAMAAAGSKLAKEALERGLYIPAQDELEIVYRNLKPTTEKNWCYARSGINLHAVPPTLPYTPDFPAQSIAEAFRAGGAEAIESGLYWTSTQHAGYSDWAWCQYFGHGNQSYYHKSSELPALLVRRELIR